MEHPEVQFAGGDVVELGPDVLDDLKRRAAKAPLRRPRLCLHRGHDDTVHEMVIALGRDSYVPPHRHLSKSESFHLIEGEVLVVLFDEEGRVARRIHLGPPGSGRPFLYRLSPPSWHSVVPLTEFAAFHETTNGPFVPGSQEIAPWAPDPDDTGGIQAFVARIARASP